MEDEQFSDPLIAMDMILDSLKMLDYENKFCDTSSRDSKTRPVELWSASRARKACLVAASKA